MICEHKEGGWTAFCWRCSLDGWVPKPTPSLHERIARLRRVAEVETELVQDLKAPLPAIYDVQQWPKEPRLWLYKAGMSNDAIETNGFYYHERSERVVMPVGPSYWQARGFDTTRPKYINPPLNAKPIFKAGDAGPLVITEDILSAIRVGEVARGWCVTGTSTSDDNIREIASAKCDVFVWLDPDAAGIKGRRKTIPRLRAYGVNARSIRTPKDPKYYNRQEIADFIGIDASKAP